MGTGLIPADKGHGPPPRRNAHRLAPDGRWHDPIAARARKNGDRPAPTARRAQLVGRRPLRIRLSRRGSSSLGHRPGPLGPVRKDRAPDAHAKRRTRIPPTADAGRSGRRSSRLFLEPPGGSEWMAVGAGVVRSPRVASKPPRPFSTAEGAPVPRGRSRWLPRDLRGLRKAAQCTRGRRHSGGPGDGNLVYARGRDDPAVPRATGRVNRTPRIRRTPESARRRKRDSSPSVRDAAPGRDDPPRKICLDFPPQPRPHATHRAPREGVANEGQSRRSL